MRSPGCVLITGASGGIGGALALAYARPGCALVLHGRDAARLGEIAARCERAGAEVQTWQLELRDTGALFAWLEELAARRLPDLAIVSAGVAGGTARGAVLEPWPEVERVLDVNLRAAMATVTALAPHMQRRGAGQIALLSSLAAWYGMPRTPAYCASKAALKAWAEALRGALAPHGVAVNVVLPGFVRTPMSDGFRGPRPFMLEPEDAAARIVEGLARNRARISFPFPLDAGTWLLSAMPAGVAGRILRLLGYGA